MKLLVADLQRFCLRDGPGIRTTVFLKGCDLQCAWCHNPETILASPQLRWSKGKCLHCGLCSAACDRFEPEGGLKGDAAECSLCGNCVARCPAGALDICGKYSKIEDICDAALRDSLFHLRSGGGVTLSGGEPLLQPGTAALLKMLRDRGSHTAVDTALHVPWEKIEGTMPFTSLYLVDVKAIDGKTHKRLTGADNGLILGNLKRLADSGIPIWARVPVIPEANEKELPLIASYLRSLPQERLSLELIPFHNYAANKYAGLGKRYAYEHSPAPSPDAMNGHRRIFEGLRMVSYSGTGDALEFSMPEPWPGA